MMTYSSASSQVSRLWTLLRDEFAQVVWPIAFLAIWLLGAIGWQGSAPGERWLDSAYRAVQLFGFNFDAPDHDFTVSWQLEIARFAAASFTVAAFVLTLGRSLVLTVRALVNAMQSRRQVVVLGAGRVGDGLARALRQSDRRMRLVMIDRTVTAANRRMAASDRIELFEIDAHNHAAMTAGKIGIARAARIIVACGSDAATMAVGTRIAGMLPHGMQRRIWLHLCDPRLLAGMRDRPDLPAGADRWLEVFSLREAAARHLVMTLRPPVLARDLGQQGVHGIIHGFGDLGWSALEQFILNSAAPGQASPRFTVLTRDAETAARRWRAAHPAIDRVASVDFVTADVMALAMTDPAQPALSRVEQGAAPTFHFFACGSDETAMTGALHMRKAMAMGARPACPVAVRSWHCGAPGAALEVESGNLRNRLIVIGDACTSARRSIAVDSSLEDMARHIHDSYRANMADAGPSYNDLPDSLRESNRRAAAHYFLKLAWLGFDQVDGTKPGYGLRSDDVAEIELAYAQQAEAFYELEHLRWCADRVLDGWTEGPRDDERRRRDQLQPYAALSPAETGKDRGQLDALLAYLRAAVAQDAPNRGDGHGEQRRGRVVDQQVPDRPAWRHDGSRLLLAFDAPVDWRTMRANDASRTRFVITVPPEPAMQDGETPLDRANRRRRAYAEFVDGLLSATAGMDAPLPCFRLRRADPAGWEWLPDRNRVDGC